MTELVMRFWFGHQRFDAVPVAHDDVAAAQFLDPAEILGAGAGGAGEADDVAGLDGFVEQQHEARDEIAGDGLQAEAQPRPMAPVNRPSTVRSTPEALMPNNTPRPTSRNVENFEMPMRVEIARPSSFMTRRSMVRAIRLVTIRKPTMTTTLLSSAQRLNVVLPGSRSMLSSVRSMPLNQPSTWKAMPPRART